MIDTKPLFEHDLKLKQQYNFIAGIDEVGRGPLAGPVVTCAMVLKPDVLIEGVNDSKKVSEKNRDKLFEIIIDNCIEFIIGHSFVLFI